MEFRGFRDSGRTCVNAYPLSPSVGACRPADGHDEGRSGGLAA